MGVKGTYAIRGIEVVCLLAIGHHVDGSSQGIATEPRRYYTFIYLYMVNHTDGQIGQCDARAFCVERHTIDEVSHGIARHSVDAQVEVAAQSTFLAYLHTCCMVNQTVQVADAANHRTYVDGIHGKSPFAQLLCLALTQNGNVVKCHGVAHRVLS